MTTDHSDSSSPKIEILREVFAAINRNDISSAIKFFDPQIERIEPLGFPTAGTYRGHSEVQAHLSHGRGTWAEGSCEPEQFIVAGERVIVFLYVLVRLKNREDWIEGRFADVFTFRNGLIVEMRTFGERQQALEWAGAKL